MLRKPQNRKILSYLSVFLIFLLFLYIYFIAESKEKYIFIKKCNCTKKINISQITNFSTYNKPGLVGDFISTCSKEADERGVNQNIISFSLFSDNNPKEKATRSDLLRGIHSNYEAAQTNYTDWVLRIYSDFKINKKICNDFICKYPNLDWCDMKDLKILPNTFLSKYAWRFLTLGDPLVHKVISRDLDSIVSERERAAVKVWENSVYIFHSMRDHHMHDKGMLGGTWGAKVNLFKNATQVTKEIIKNGISNIYELDQDLTIKFIYNPFEELFIAHDPYYCKKYKNSHPFPTKRKNNELDWVGSVKNVPAKKVGHITKKCPKECRTSYGQDWEFC